MKKILSILISIVFFAPLIAAATNVSIPWLRFNNTGERPTFPNDQILIGATATTTLNPLEVHGLGYFVNGLTSADTITTFGGINLEGSGVPDRKIRAYNNAHDTLYNLIQMDSSNNVRITPNDFTGLGLFVTSGGDGATFNLSATGHFEVNTGDFITTSNQLTILSNGNAGLGTSSPYNRLSVVGTTTAAVFEATTTATSTFAGGIKTNLLNVVSTTASSTFGNGIVLTNGCIQINGSCSSGGGSGTVNSGILGQLAWYAGSGTTISGTGTPQLTVGNILATSSTATSTFAGGIQTNLLKITSASASSTFANGINVTAGCFAISGSCVGGSQWTTSGSNIFYTAGNVGIGTTSPMSLLAVAGTITANNINATSSTATSTFNGGLAVGSGSAPSGLVYDLSTGRVGIGTNAPTVTFEVSAANNASQFTGSASSIFSVLSTGTGGAGISIQNKNATGDPTIQFRTGTGPTTQFLLGVDQSDSNKFKIGTTVLGSGDLFTLQSNGNVGIGTTSPGSLLSLAGSSGGTSALFMVSTSTSNATNTAFAIDLNGNVGIGTGVPSRMLDLSSSVNAPLAQFINANTGSGAGGVLIQTSDGNGTANALLVNTNGSVASSIFPALVVKNIGGPGYVGVGTSTPGANFAIAGRAGGTNNLFLISTSTSGFSTTTAFTVDSQGRVIVNGSAPASTSDVLDVLTTSGSGSVRFGNAGGLVVQMPSTFGGGTGRVALSSNFNEGLIGLQDVNANQHFIIDKDTSTMWAIGTLVAGNGLELLSNGLPNAVLKGSGSFGIGTTTPWGMLSIATSSNTSSTPAPLFVIASSSPSVATSTLFLVNGNGNVGIGTTSPSSQFSIDTKNIAGDYLNIGSSLGETARFFNGGNVCLLGCINGAVPTHGVEIGSNFEANGITSQGPLSTIAGNDIISDNNFNTTGSGVYEINGSAGVSCSGDAAYSNGGLVTGCLSSDTNFKNILGPLEPVLDKFDLLHPFYYTWNDAFAKAYPAAASIRTRIGISAQDLQSVFPEAVVTNKTANSTSLGIDPSQTTAILIEAIKELKAQNEVLKARLDAAGIK